MLVGTQMVTKGHDFRRITLVAALNADSALFSSDFRAPERLFALLLQAAGSRRARRAARRSQPDVGADLPAGAPLVRRAAGATTIPAFAAQQLAEREAAAMPPFAYQALVRAEARTQEVAQGFLRDAAAAAQQLPQAPQVTVYPAVPMAVQRVANVERAQMLVESSSRPALQRFLADWQPLLQAQRCKGLIRWAVDVDPLAI